jgi:transcriptional regulator with XRE-family HTH domain
MTAVSGLRMARLKRGLTLDDLFLRSAGKLAPARISRIERGLCVPSDQESTFLIQLLGVTEQTIRESSVAVRPCEMGAAV